MALRKPLVLVDGKIAQLPAGDSIPGGSGSTSVQCEFNRSGSVNTNAWLYVGEIPSNESGIEAFLASSNIAKVSIKNNTVSTFDITFYEHDGNLTNLTTLGTLTVTAATGDDFTPAYAITQGKQIAARLTNRTVKPKNLLVDFLIEG